MSRPRTVSDEDLVNATIRVMSRLGPVKLGALAVDPGILVRFDEDLQRAELAISARRASLALLRSVLRWGRRRYPRTLNGLRAVDDVAPAPEDRSS